MDERPIPPDEFEPDWQKILVIVGLGIVAIVSFLVLTPCIILLWKAALRS